MEKKTPSKFNSDLTRFNKVIYKILHESIVQKLGGIDQISVCHKMFIYHVAKGDKVNTGKLIFSHLLEAINSKKSHVQHCRLLSHMFAQIGLLDAVKPIFPGFGAYMVDPQIINATTLRYLKLIKADKIVYPTHPLLVRQTEDGIGESYLVCVKEEEAKKIASDCANFIDREFGVEENQSEKQKSLLLGNPIKIPSKRKATKNASGPRPKKAPKVASGKRKPKKQRKLLMDVTEEEAEQADVEAALAKVAAFKAKEKEREKELENSWDSGGVEPNKDAHIDSELSPEAAALLLKNQKIYKVLEKGKHPDYLVNGLAPANVYTISTLKQPPLVNTKHIFENLFTDIELKDSHPKRRCLPQCESLGELFPDGVYSYPKPKSSKPPQISSQPTLTDHIYDVAETGDTNSGHLSEID
jgi:hypothetical protein